MNDQTIKAIVDELAPALVGCAWGKVFQFSRTSLVIDFRGDGGAGGGYLFVSVDPSDPRLYLVRRKVRELEKASIAPSPFALTLRKVLSGATVRSISKEEGDRIVRFILDTNDALGNSQVCTLVAQLTGRAANLFLLDETDRVLEQMRPAKSTGLEQGGLYLPPEQGSTSNPQASVKPLSKGDFASVSEAADDYYERRERENAFDSRVAAAGSKLKQEAARRRKLLANLARDLAAYGDADQHKREGDLLLANIANAVREGSIARVTDFYAEGMPLVEIEIDETRSLQQEAAKRFALYAKARRAAQEVARRIGAVEKELAELNEKLAVLDDVAARRDEDALETFTPSASTKPASKRGQSTAAGDKTRGSQIVPGVRRYRSSDGFEILVGRGSRDNDHLTFRVARSNDTWLHAADYPGSHVVIRNHQRDREIPHRTIIEAAQLAAQFSQARNDAKVAVNYTLRKFVSKPKAAAPGLVRLASFRTLLVEPGDKLERI